MNLYESISNNVKLKEGNNQELFKNSLKELEEEFCYDGDTPYDSTPNSRYQNFIEELKELCKDFDQIFDNLTHTLVQKVDDYVKQQLSVSEIVDTMINECNNEQ